MGLGDSIDTPYRLLPGDPPLTNERLVLEPGEVALATGPGGKGARHMLEKTALAFRNQSDADAACDYMKRTWPWRVCRIIDAPRPRRRLPEPIRKVIGGPVILAFLGGYFVFAAALMPIAVAFALARAIDKGARKRWEWARERHRARRERKAIQHWPAEITLEPAPFTIWQDVKAWEEAKAALVDAGFIYRGVFLARGRKPLFEVAAFDRVESGLLSYVVNARDGWVHCRVVVERPDGSSITYRNTAEISSNGSRKHPVICLGQVSTADVVAAAMANATVSTTDRKTDPIEAFRLRWTEEREDKIAGGLSEAEVAKIIGVDMTESDWAVRHQFLENQATSF